jgi:hypothetical protein
MKTLLLLWILISTFSIQAQWQNIWTSPNIPGIVLTGYLNFQKNGNSWNKRFYYLDTVKFYVSNSPTSITPEYTYFFTPEEKLAGYELYSLQTDLTGDGITEFYVIGYVGTSTNYRQYVKIFNIVNNSIVFQGNQSNYSYSYPSLIDLNSDGLLECVFLKWNFPYTNTYFYEVYSTGVTPADEPIEPIGYKLNQNYPNPFNSETNISFSLNKASQVKLKIYGVNGEEITTLLDEYKMAGNHQIRWNGLVQNKRITSSVYFYELIVDGISSVKKMIHLK